MLCACVRPDTGRYRGSRSIAISNTGFHRWPFGMTGIPLSEFGKPFTGDIYSLHVDSLIQDDAEVRDRSPPETPDLSGDLGGEDQNTLVWVC